MANHCHSRRARNACPFEVAHRGAPEIMRDAASEAGLLAGRGPRLAETKNPFSVLMKQPRDDLVALLFEHPRLFELQCEYFAQPRNQREISPLTIFTFTRLEPKPAGI